MPELTRPLLMAAALFAVLAAGAWAQDNDHALPGAGSTVDRPNIGANVPGWTGRTVVIGSHSTVAGTAVATRLQQTGQYSPQR